LGQAVAFLKGRRACRADLTGVNGHAGSHQICPLLKVDRTCHRATVTAHIDPKQTKGWTESRAAPPDCEKCVMSVPREFALGPTAESLVTQCGSPTTLACDGFSTGWVAARRALYIVGIGGGDEPILRKIEKNIAR
jgi:hypothetical protein